MKAKEKSYPTEFKLEVLKKVEESDCSISEVARQLGLRQNLIYKWRKQIEATGDARPSRRGQPRNADLSEDAKLRLEVQKLREENEILKKAAVVRIQIKAAPMHLLAIKNY
jgi:transposase